MFEKPLGLRENPFLAGHHPRYLFPSREHQEALAHLRYGIQNREPFVLITGEVGTGKTTAVYDALAEWGSRAVVALITNSALSRAELLEEICLRFGISLPTPVSKPQALVELQKQLTAIRERGELAILLVDEAQNLDRELLEEIRLLSNLEVGGEYLLQIFLVGQPELESKLAQKELRQLKQRIGIHYRILPLSATETARYVHHRVSVAGGNAQELFPTETCVDIFRITNGIPREINVVAGQSLLNAFVEDSRSVTVEHVRSVEREIEFQSVLKKRPEDAAGAAPAAATAPAGAPPRMAATPAAPPPAKKPAAPPPAAAMPARHAEPAAKAHAAPPHRRAVAPAPPEPPVDDEVEVSEAGFREPAAEIEDTLVDDLPAEPAALAPADVEELEEGVEDEERPETGIRRVEAEAEQLLPSWIDEIVKRRQAIDQRMAELAAQAAAAPPPPIPLRAVEPFRARGAGEEHEVSGARLAAPAPERIAPHPADPIPLFETADSRTGYLSPRFERAEGEESEPPRRYSMAWPIASVVLAALAVAVLLVVRFGPWTLERRVQPANPPVPAVAPVDSTPHSSTPYPPFDRMNQPGSAFVTHRPRRVATAPDTTLELNGTQNPSAPLAGAAANPSAPTTSGGSATGSAGPATFGIAVGDYVNEARANAERLRMGDATKLASRVVTVAEDTVSTYRVVVGSFSDRIAAERAASDLVQRGVVNEARVVSLAQTASGRP